MFSFKHRWIADIFVLSLIVYFGVGAVMAIMDSRLAPTSLKESESIKLHQEVAAEVKPLQDYAIIAERNLFGGNAQGLSEAQSEKIDIEGMPVAVQSLGLKLVGTAVSSKPEDSSAIIEDLSTRKQDVYREGDEVKNTRIKKILRHNVIINSGRRDEVLTMVEDEGTEKSAAHVRPTRGRPTPPSESSSIQLDREELESQMADLNELMQQVRIRPFMEGRNPAGFLVSNIKPGSLFSKMGLRNGDVIQGVNGQTITTPDQAIELYEGLMQGGSIDLEIKRGRRTQKLRYAVE